MTRGMPGAWQVSIGSAITLPASFLRTFSWIARYSGVSGASRLLAPSHRSGPMRCQRPLRSGYLASSKACAALAIPKSAVRAMNAAVVRETMVVTPVLSSALRLEMPQIGRRLPFLRWHQEPVGAEEVALLADGDVIVVLRAEIFAPERILLRRAAVALGHDPWPRERIVDDGDLVAQDVAVVLVEIDALLHHRLVVRVERQAGGIVSAAALDVAGLGLERVELAVAVGIDPSPDRVARIGRLDLLRPVAAIGVDAAMRLMDVIDHDEGDLGQDHELHRLVGGHHRRHAGWAAAVARPQPLAAGGEVAQVLFEHLLVFLGQRRFLAPAARLAGVEGRLARRRDAAPLALEVGIECVVERAGAHA